MTALKKYQKLECSGLWRADGQAQLREVTVNLGDTSLMLADPKKDVSLTHWSLPAVRRLNPGEHPAIFSPGTKGDETLELDDQEMIAALATVDAALRAARPHPGRLRNGILTLILVAIVGTAVFWLPEAAIRQTVSVLPSATRSEIGARALADLTQLTGQPCTSPRGRHALDLLSERLSGSNAPIRLLVMREGVETAVTLPGRQIVIGEPLLAEQDGPELAAGFALAHAIAIEKTDPMIPLLEYVGLPATIQLLTTGALPEGAVEGYGKALLQNARAPRPDDDIILQRFEAAGLTTAPYAYGLDPSGETTRNLIEADPFATVAPAPLLQDEDWVGLQDICTK